MAQKVVEAITNCNVNGCERFQNAEDRLSLFGVEQVSFAAGIQLHKYSGRYVLSPFGEYSIGYKDHVSCLICGCFPGCYFP